MKELFVNISRPDGEMEMFVAHPEASERFRAVILYMDIFGLREGLFDLARRVASANYYCLVPDFHYRRGKIRLTLPAGRGWTLADLASHSEQQVREAGRALTNGMVVDDTGAILTFLENAPILRGPKGAIGFCMGGRHAICVAAHYPETFKATASLHGSNLVTDDADSPHHRARRLRGEIYCGFAENDPLAPISAINHLSEVLRGCEVRYRWQLHKGAAHGYALPDRNVHNARAAQQDWAQIFAMLQQQLPPSDG